MAATASTFRSRKSTLTSAYPHPLIILGLVWLFYLLTGSHTSSAVEAADLLTNQFCNYTLYPKTGCEDEEGAECFEGKCRCKPGNTILLLGRFCLDHHCSGGQYYERWAGRCVPQRRASNRPDESNCRYDFHCFGNHVRCVLYGWNRNCKCDPGFSYDSYSQTCKPMYGIGGHCKQHSDCDSTGLRKMMCSFEPQHQPESISSAPRDPTSGTCQCFTDHRYNYHIDGCEPLTEIAAREHHMRTLILIFIVAGVLFGATLTCNFGFFGRSPKHQELMLKRLKEEQDRMKRRQQQQALVKDAEEGQAASAPPAETAPDHSPPALERSKGSLIAL